MLIVYYQPFAGLAQNRKECFNMSQTTITKSDKIKLLDQLLEDLAGDEYEDYDADENRAGKGVKHHDISEDLEEMESFH
jgi:hypothetical protein